MFEFAIIRAARQIMTPEQLEFAETLTDTAALKRYAVELLRQFHERKPAGV